LGELVTVRDLDNLGLMHTGLLLEPASHQSTRSAIGAVIAARMESVESAAD
jgi:hypothetical protein